MLTPDFPPALGGIQRLVHEVVRHWRRIDARVVTMGTAGSNGFDRTDRFDVRRITGRGFFGHKGSIARLNVVAVVEALRFRPQAVLSAHIVTSPAAWLIRNLLDTPVIQYLYLGEVNARPRLAQFAVGQATAVVAISRTTEALALARGAEAGRVHVIPPGVDMRDGHTMSRSTRPLMVTVSRLHDHYKGHDAVIEALPLVRAHVPDVLWVIIGEGRLRPFYEGRVRELGLGPYVRFLGAVSDAERDAWLDRAHVFVMPSRSTSNGQGEGFGIVYLEAAAHALPVVAGNCGGALDAVVDNETGLLVDPTDSQAIARALIELLLDKQHAMQLGRAAAERARRYDWAHVAAQVEELLMQVARH